MTGWTDSSLIHGDFEIYFFSGCSSNVIPQSLLSLLQLLQLLPVLPAMEWQLQGENNWLHDWILKTSLRDNNYLCTLSVHVLNYT